MSSGADDDAVVVPSAVSDKGTLERDVGWVRYPDDAMKSWPYADIKPA